MGIRRTGHYRQLPLVPEALLRQHRVYEKHDHRFRACARLLQALWRQEQGLPMGTHIGRNGQRKIGSLLGGAAAAAGRNFLTPDVALLARREVIYQEVGALIERQRLFGNLLSSMPLAFNLFAPLRFDLEFAARVVRSLIPDIDLARVVEVWFEHSPGRSRPEFTEDRTAFDVAIVYERRDGQRGLLAIEQKYSEGTDAAVGEHRHRYGELARSSEMYKNPMHGVLRTGPCQQLFREHLLTVAATQGGAYAEARFVLIAPRHNHLIQQGAALYASMLTEPQPGSVPFINLELERVIEAIAWAGQLDYAQILYDRYCNWLKVDLAVEDALRADAAAWSKPARAKPAALPVLAAAA